VAKGPALAPHGVFPAIAHHVSAQEKLNNTREKTLATTVTR